MRTRGLGLPLGLFISVGLLAGLAATNGLAAYLLLPGNPILEPVPNDHQVEASASVSITYDQDIDPDTVNESTFAVFGMESGLVSGSYSVEGGAIRLTPDQAFHAGELMQTSATTATLSLDDGLGPIQPTVWQFRARAEGGSAFFKDTGQELGEMNSLAVTLGDLDEDGDLDAFVAACWPSYVWVNTGGGFFVDSGQEIGVGMCSVDAAIGDLDGDGDLDIFTVNTGEYWGRVWKNDGYGKFTDTNQNLAKDLGRAVALGDLDGDADLDAIYVREGSPLVLLNDGTGVFEESGQALAEHSSMDVALGDLNGDGSLDVYVANVPAVGYLSEDRVYLNDGEAVLTEKVQALSESTCNGASLGDLDGDGDLDVYLAVAYSQGSSIGPDEVWLNDGTGVFTLSDQQIGIASTNQANLADLDGDGDLDAFIANLYAPSQVWENNGQGTFNLTRQFLDQFSRPFHQLGDMDGDGDVDAFMIDYGKPGTIWLNQNFVYWNFAPQVFNTYR